MLNTNDFVVMLFSFEDGFVESVPSVGFFRITPSLVPSGTVTFPCVILRRDQFIIESKYARYMDPQIITRVPTLYEAVQFNKYEKLSRL